MKSLICCFLLLSILPKPRSIVEAGFSKARLETSESGGNSKDPYSAGYFDGYSSAKTEFAKPAASSQYPVAAAANYEFVQNNIDETEENFAVNTDEAAAATYTRGSAAANYKDVQNSDGEEIRNFAGQPVKAVASIYAPSGVAANGYPAGQPWEVTAVQSFGSRADAYAPVQPAGTGGVNYVPNQFSGDEAAGYFTGQPFDVSAKIYADTEPSGNRYPDGSSGNGVGTEYAFAQTVGQFTAGYAPETIADAAPRNAVFQPRYVAPQPAGASAIYATSQTAGDVSTNAIVQPFDDAASRYAAQPFNGAASRYVASQPVRDAATNSAVQLVRGAAAGNSGAQFFEVSPGENPNTPTGGLSETIYDVAETDTAEKAIIAATHLFSALAAGYAAAQSVNAAASGYAGAQLDSGAVAAAEGNFVGSQNNLWFPYHWLFHLKHH